MPTTSFDKRTFNRREVIASESNVALFWSLLANVAAFVFVSMRQRPLLQDQLAATDAKSREQILQRFAKLEDERKRSVPLFWCGESFAVGKRIKELKPAVGSPYHLKLESVELVGK